MAQPQKMPSNLLESRAHGGGDFDLSLKQLVLDLSLFRDGCQAGRGTHLLYERCGKECLRGDQQVLLFDPNSDHAG